MVSATFSAPRESRPTVVRRSLHHRARSQSPVATLSDRNSEPTFPQPVTPKRAVSYPETTVLRHRISIQYQDEALRLRSLENVKKLLQTAAHAEQSGNNASPTTSEILARKALKYRKVLGRMSDVDVNDPTFDASAFLGVEWCKQTPSTSITSSLESSRKYAMLAPSA